MRIVFFGTPDLAIPSLEAIARRHEVVAVVCRPDSPRGRGRKVASPPVKGKARELGTPVHQPEKLHDGAFETWLREQRPDLCVVVAYGRILKQPILDVPKCGFLNLHPSLLPLYRGPSPIQAAILNGDAKTGVSFIKLILEMDAGDILLQEELPILPQDTTASLSQRLGQIGAELFPEALELVETGRAVFTPQDHSKATYCKLFEKEDGQIDWTKPARAIHNLVRAAIPWPIAHSPLKGEVLLIYESQTLDEDTQQPPGTIIQIDRDRICVATGEGVLAVRRLQAPGRRVLPAAEFLRGHPVSVGDQFHSP